MTLGDTHCLSLTDEFHVTFVCIHLLFIMTCNSLSNYTLMYIRITMLYINVFSIEEMPAMIKHHVDTNNADQKHLLLW